VFAQHRLPKGLDTGRVESVDACDLDSDGDLDVVAAAYGGSTNPDNIVWFENDGAETFAMHVIATYFGDAQAVACANLDGDGDIDVVAGHSYYGSTAWFENDGNESFTERTISSIRSSTLQIIDLDDDTDMDIVASASLDRDILWWENNGSQSFTRHTLASDEYGASSAYAVDLDGDGDLDILSSAEWEYHVIWWENGGSENFAPHTIQDEYYGVDDLHAVDLDDDGDVDVLGVDSYHSELVWWENDGAESFTKNVLSSAFIGGSSVRGVDFDIDGDVDILAGATADGVVWWENDGNESFLQHTIDGSVDGYDVAAWDIDGDSDLDVLGGVGGVYWWEQLPNQAPILTWTGEANYVDDGVQPDRGTIDDDYVYRVAYSDANNDPPASVQVQIRKGGVDIVGSPFAMTCEAGDYAAGVVCSYTQAGLELGTDYAYTFSCEDDQGNPAAPTIEKHGPDVNIFQRVYLPLVQRNAGPPATPELHAIDNGDGDNRYTVRWGAADRASGYQLEQSSDPAFSDATVVYSGSNTSKSIVVGEVGTYYYRVMASNEFGVSGWSNVRSAEVTHIPGILPQPGVWECWSAPGVTVRFTVSGDSASASNGYIHISCGSLTIPGPEPIVDSSFGLLDPGGDGHISVTFDSETSGSGGYSIFKSDTCWAAGTMHCSP
jgi:hypothetical protein